MRPKKSLGQNFLVDGHARSRIVRALGLGPDDAVLEIGPGRGEITALIAGCAGRITAVEFDRTLIAPLRELLMPYPGARVVEGDILKADIPGILDDLRAGDPEGRVKVFGNIPYYISTPIIEMLSRNRDRVSEAYITVQKEFAQRMAAAPGTKTFGALSCFVQYHFLPEILFLIKRNSFWPVPKVDSALVKLTVRPQPLLAAAGEERMFSLVRAAFQQRRKTLRNCLKGLVGEEEISLFLSRRGLPPGTRPERLSLQDFIALSLLRNPGEKIEKK